MKKGKKETSYKFWWLSLAACLVIAIIAWFSYRSSNLTGAAADVHDNRKLLESRESLYNNIYIYGMDNRVLLTFGYNSHYYVESIYNTRDELDLPAPYTRFMSVGLIYAKKAESILLIGFGGGRTDWYLHHSLPNTSVTSVELDPVVIELAHKYFGIKDEPNFKVVNQDGRIFLADSKDRYDIIIIDAYRGPFVPFHLLTTEFYRMVKNHLADGGVVVQNVESRTMLFDSAVKTISAVFPNMDFYVAGVNVVTVAYDGPERTPDDLARSAAERQNAFHTRYDLSDMLKQRQHGFEGTISPKAKVLTDDFAPVESLRAIEQNNRKWQDQQPTK